MEIFVRMAQYTQFYSELSNKILGKRFSSAEYTYKCVGNSARYTGTQIIPSTSPSPFTMLGYLHIKCFFKSYCQRDNMKNLHNIFSENGKVKIKNFMSSKLENGRLIALWYKFQTISKQSLELFTNSSKSLVMTPLPIHTSEVQLIGITSVHQYSFRG